MSVTSVLVYLLFGFLIGALARFLVPGKDPMAWWQTILLGVTGSFIGGWLGSFVKLGISGSLLGVPISGLILGVGGAVLVLVILRILR
ncbi:MAG: GlsB/YeaQ/YmgE family stress response membrane protein [Deltaproteobacteria bacterium]|nr:GlsB/YeaQ/YmgE family stress response membrane protein [Deltaproteobacteria bacterium]